jgi:glycosyltransferase involved in cell wall biosynthesis
MQMNYSNNMRLVIVSPCFNEEMIIAESSAILNAVLEKLIAKDKISSNSIILFVNDGSTDNTWGEILKAHLTYSHVCGLNLAMNVGQQFAIMAGLMTSRNIADAIITIDSDLQDDINAIEQMVDRYHEGADVVYGVKNDRTIDPWYKRKMASLFYHVQGFLGVKTIKDHADFRLLSHTALETLATYPERNIFLRGLIPLMGYDVVKVDDVLSPRIHGESKFTISKQIHLAIDGITSFTTKPLEYIYMCGSIMLAVAILMFIYVAVSFVLGHVIAGWASLMLSVWFIGAVLTMGVGLIGIYIGKIYMEVKQRPMYRISDSIGLKFDKSIIHVD